MDIAAPKRRRLAIGDEDILAEEGKPQLQAQRQNSHAYAGSDAGSPEVGPYSITLLSTKHPYTIRELMPRHQLSQSRVSRTRQE